MLRAIPFLPPFWSKSGAITLRGEDPDGDPPTFELVDRPIHGELKGTPPALTYVPNSCFAGIDHLTSRVSERKLDSEVATVAIHVGEETFSPSAMGRVDLSAAASNCGCRKTST